MNKILKKIKFMIQIAMALCLVIMIAFSVGYFIDGSYKYDKECLKSMGEYICQSHNFDFWSLEPIYGLRALCIYKEYPEIDGSITLDFTKDELTSCLKEKYKK